MNSGKHIRAGMVVNDWQDVGSNWLPYVGVANLIETILKAHESGGSLLAKVGNSAVILDPAGAAIGIHQIDDGGKK